ncbi:MAG: AAA family ATPase [Calditrichaeota bacterium]|nr:AAA family ATPase [Calditrichota bacterium]MCB9391152.1 AAA family ATPase [Calditrichota bacterium]
MDADIRELTLRIEREAELADRILAEAGKVVVGQKMMLERLLIGLLSNGHVLLEGVPGLAKTLTIKTLASTVSAHFQRIQFTPDLLPADLVGTLVYNQKDGNFTTKKGPVFANFVLADEINRAPAKVQSALLEAMQEQQVTIGEHTFPLPQPFLVLATQNPIEQEGTYPLPEAQVDRFMLKVKVDYPRRDEEARIMRTFSRSESQTINAVATPDELLRIRSMVESIYVDPKIEDYVLDIVFSSRQPEHHKLPDLKPLIQYGASPRASIFLLKAARAHAFLRHRGYVVPEDIRAVGMDVLRHRIGVTYEAEAEEVTSEAIVEKIFNTVEVP